MTPLQIGCDSEGPYSRQLFPVGLVRRGVVLIRSDYRIEDDVPSASYRLEPRSEREFIPQVIGELGFYPRHGGVVNRALYNNSTDIRWKRRVARRSTETVST